jgi:hypothetical protein
MSLNTEAVLRAALETHLAGTELLSTGTRGDLAASATGYVRASGSFVADGFRPGDTVRPDGFADTRPAIVLAVSDLALVVDRDVTPEAAPPAASLAVILPERRRFEGQPFVRPKNKPWLRAGLRPAAAPLVAFGGGGLVRQEGAFVVELFEPVDAGRGLARIERLAAGLRARFAPGQRLSRDGHVVRTGEVRRGNVQETPEHLSLAVSIQWACEIAA